MIRIQKELFQGHLLLSSTAHDYSLGPQCDECRGQIGRVGHGTFSDFQDGVIVSMFPCHGVTFVTSFLITEKMRVSEIGAPGSLTEVPSNRAHIPERCRSYLQSCL